MAAEISMFQKIILFFKHPSLALIVLLATLLVGTGTGSLLSLKIADRKIIKSIKISTTLVFLTLFIFIFLISKVKFNSNPSSQFFLILLLFTNGLFMGFPFPLLIRYTGLMGLKDRIPWYWGINGVSSVAGSTFAVIIAKTMGWYFALGTAALFYIITALLIALSLKSTEYSTEEIDIKDYVNSEISEENISRSLTQ
jgi:MFS family permease